MTAADAPVLIAYDGSDTARHAVREAARLLGSREVLVVTIWEPALAYESSMPTAAMEMPPVPVDVEGAREIERGSSTNAPAARRRRGPSWPAR